MNRCLGTTSALPTFVFQAGGYDAGVAANAVAEHKTTNAAITPETNAGLSNTTLTVGMARTGIPDSATSEFFINLADNLNLNQSATARGYAGFGSMTAGANVITAMKAAPCVAARLLAGVSINGTTARSSTLDAPCPQSRSRASTSSTASPN